MCFFLTMRKKWQIPYSVRLLCLNNQPQSYLRSLTIKVKSFQHNFQYVLFESTFLILVMCMRVCTLLSPGCLPVHVTYLVSSSEPDSGALYNLEVSDVTPGIKDPSIFNVPPQCKSIQVTTKYHLSLPKHLQAFFFVCVYVCLCVCVCVCVRVCVHACLCAHI